MLVAIVVPFTIGMWAIGFFLGSAASTRRLSVFFSLWFAVMISGLLIGSLAAQRGLTDATQAPGIGLPMAISTAAATVIGGTSLAGGVGRITGTVIGTVILGVMTSGFTFLRVDAFYQEIVKGVTTDFAGPNLGKIEIAHWYESVFLLGVIWLFFAWNPLLAIAAIIIAYFLEILIDNTISRFKWQLMLRSAWIVAGTLGLVNLGVLYYLGMVVVP